MSYKITCIKDQFTIKVQQFVPAWKKIRKQNHKISARTLIEAFDKYGFKPTVNEV